MLCNQAAWNLKAITCLELRLKFSLSVLTPRNLPVLTFVMCKWPPQMRGHEG